MKKKSITSLFLGMLAIAVMMVLSPVSSMASPHTMETTYGEFITDEDYWTGFVQYDTGIHATQDWNNNGTKLSWNITEDNNIYTYSYIWETAENTGDLSHIIIEMTPETDILLLTEISVNIEDDSPEIKYHTEQQGNPGLPQTFYGIKLDLAQDSKYFAFSFTSFEAPVWGNFYSKDGNKDSSTTPPGATYAHNLGFGSETGVFIATPDGKVAVPEPATMLWLGTALFGLFMVSRKKFMK